MESLTNIRKKPISEIMKKDITIVERNETAAKAIQLLMKDQKTMAIIVKPRDEDDTYGIVTERDILEKVIDPGADIHKEPWNTPVHEIMSKPLISVYPELQVKYAIRLMKKAKIRHLAVMSGKNLVGLVSETDLLNYISDILPPKSEKTAL
ncbi:MAG: CBS domain-containing protein [Spirochaetia bacterium]|nr:CBS domain-containing protein [Spirochaetia bacterium]